MMDPAGTVHNAEFLCFFERARTDFWKTLGAGYTADGLFDYPFLVARNEVNYRRAIRSDQEITVTVAVSNLGRTSVTFAHEVYDEEGVLSADGSTVIVRIAADSNRPIPWSDRFRELVKPILLPAE